MHLENKSILVLAYKYPPFSLVGGNRWKNFSMNLAQLGYEVHVVTTNWKLKGTVPTHPNLKIHQYSHKSLHNLRYQQYTTVPHLLRQALFRFILDPLFLNGQQDEASEWCLAIEDKMNEFISSHNISVLMATGAPFSVNYFASKLKKQFPHLKLVQDFRDPWSKDPHMKNASSFIDQERASIEYADGIVSVSDLLVKEFLGDRQDKRHETIRNGFDLDLIKSIEAMPRVNSKKIFLTHIGNITNGREHPLRQMLEALANSGALREKFKIVLVGTMNRHARKIVDNYINRFGDSSIEVIARVPQKVALSIVKSSTYALQLNEPNGDSAMSTKIYEYAGLGVPTLCVNYGGEIEKLVETYKLGISINLKSVDIAEELYKLPEQVELNSDVEELSFQYQAKKLSQFIESL